MFLKFIGAVAIFLTLCLLAFLAIVANEVFFLNDEDEKEKKKEK